MDERENYMFQIPTAKQLDSQVAAIEEMELSSKMPVIFEQAFPYRSKDAQDLELYNELSAISDEVITCRNSILSNIY